MKKFIVPLVLIVLTAFSLSRSQLLSQNPNELKEVATTRTGGEAKASVFKGDRQLPASKDSNFRLENVRRITDAGDFSSAVWSPVDSEKLAFVGLSGTYLTSIPGDATPKAIAERAGFKFTWTRDGHYLIFRDRLTDQQLAIKSIEVKTGTVNTLATSSDLGLPQEVRPGVVSYQDSGFQRLLTVPTSAEPANLPAPVVFQHNDKIFVSTASETRQITTDAGQYFLPQVSPDGTKVLYQELSRGLFVTDLQTGETVSLGPGDDAAWSPDGKYVVFEITTDENDRVAAADLYLSDLFGRVSQLTQTPDLIEMRPAWSSDGKHLAFDAGGAIYIATLSQDGEAK